MEMDFYTRSHRELSPETGDATFSREETSTFLSDSSQDEVPLDFKVEDEEDESSLSNLAGGGDKRSEIEEKMCDLERTSEEKRKQDAEGKEVEMNDCKHEIKTEQNGEDQTQHTTGDCTKYWTFT